MNTNKTDLSLAFLNFDESLGRVLVDGGEEEQQLFHPLVRVQVERHEARVDQALDEQTVVQAGHIVS